VSEPGAAPDRLDDSTAGIIAPPPLIYAGFAAAAHALEYWRAAPLFEDWARWLVAGLLFAAGAGIGIAALLRFRRTGTNPRPDRPSMALATAGIYTRTRNPMYLAATLVYLALAAADNNAWFLLLLWPLLGVMHWGVIRREERYLERRFGKPYVDYCRRVRRWL
jgi:protein-S-isoprenylcysteine O-methyltransferase Ste14